MHSYSTQYVDVNRGKVNAVKSSREAKTVQTAVRLPAEMYERLKQADVGISEEIRNRVARTFAEDDAGACELAADLVAMIADIHALAGSRWHQHSDVHAAVVAAINAWFDGTPASVPPDPRSAAVQRDLLGFAPGFDAPTIGRMIAMQRLGRRPRPGMIPTTMMRTTKRKEEKE
jgi:hypothetical protein